MKIVIDTDVFLSALFSREGASHRLVTWLARNYKTKKRRYNVVSNTQIIEFSAVFQREKNLERANLKCQDIEAYIDDICLVSFHQKIHFLWRPFLKDKDDDMVLETAVNAKVEYIVTHNIKDFEGVREHFNIDVFTPKKFLQHIGELK